MKVWVDDDRRRMLVETMREMIYEHGVRPGADNVLELLGSKALTPTRVSFQYFLILSASLSRFYCHSKCLFRTSLKIWSRFSLHVRG